MRRLDEILRGWRIAKARPYIRPGDRLLDVGCHDGHLIRQLRGRIGAAVGVDPEAQPGPADGARFIRAEFLGAADLQDGQFDCVTLLAVLEHARDPEALARECHRVLRTERRVLLTVPSPRVDAILWVLQGLRLIDGIYTDQHHGFDVEQTAAIFARAGFDLLTRQRFQFGLNNLLVFIKPARRQRVITAIEPQGAPDGALVSAG
ncbi:MAG: class I SAM-dependent methyltransferase [Planctomycetes bacterium]|nr:class I SAM-dependent methyltransferase [Planctomycetota bacterium]